MQAPAAVRGLAIPQVADHFVPLLPHEGYRTDVRYDQQARQEEQRAAIVSRSVSVWVLELAVESCCSSHGLIRCAGRAGALASDETKAVALKECLRDRRIVSVPPGVSASLAIQSPSGLVGLRRNTPTLCASNQLVQ